MTKATYYAWKRDEQRALARAGLLPHYPADYYASKRIAQQTMARGYHPAAALLLDELKAVPHCHGNPRLAAELLKRARSYARLLRAQRRQSSL